MNRPQKKQRIRVTRASCGYELGKTYVVVRVDPIDSTLMAADEAGREGGWIKWEHCAVAGADISWDWLRGNIPVDALELLSAFDGLESLRLKTVVRDHILVKLPNLKERILEAQIELEDQNCQVAVMSDDDED